MLGTDPDISNERKVLMHSREKEGKQSWELELWMEEKGA